MDISSKLRLIQEGYSIEEINSPNFNVFYEIRESSIPDSILINTEYVTEMSMDIIQESSGGFLSYVERFFKWIKEKVMQFIKFLKSKFSKENTLSKDLDTRLARSKAELENLKKINSNINKVNYQVTVYTNVHDTDNYNFLSNGLEKVYEVFKKRIERTLGLTSIDSKISIFSDMFIHDEQKFLDSVFNEVFRDRYSEETIINKVYGPTKTVIVWPDDLPKMGDKVRHLHQQRDKLISYADKFISDQIKEYHDKFGTLIKEAEEKLEEGNKIRNYKIVNEQNKILHGYRSKIEELSHVYKYLMKVANQFIVAHDIVSFKVVNSLGQIVDDMEGKIKLATVHVERTTHSV